MTDQEKRTIRKILESLHMVSVETSAYDENFQPLPVKQYVEGVQNFDLLECPRFKAGYMRCYEQVVECMNFLLNASKTDLVKFAGKTKKK